VARSGVWGNFGGVFCTIMLQRPGGVRVPVTSGAFLSFTVISLLLAD